MRSLTITVWSFACIAFGVALVPVCERLDDRFPTSSGTGPVLQNAGPVLFDDPNDIRYWPSIPELQWFAQTKPDGLFRRISQEDYEARRWVWYGNQNAMILWPEDAKVRIVE